jgi:hypothetical protein
MMRFRSRLALLATGGALTLSLPPASLASSTSDAYRHQVPPVPTAPTVTAPPSPTGHGLPFTGLDVALLAVGGAGLTGLGIVVRRTADRLD